MRYSPGVQKAGLRARDSARRQPRLAASKSGSCRTSLCRCMAMSARSSSGRLCSSCKQAVGEEWGGRRGGPFQPVPGRHFQPQKQEGEQKKVQASHPPLRCRGYSQGKRALCSPLLAPFLLLASDSDISEHKAHRPNGGSVLSHVWVLSLQKNQADPTSAFPTHQHLHSQSL